jgi:hypothetical protein
MNKEQALSNLKDSIKRLMTFAVEPAVETPSYDSIKTLDGVTILIPAGAELAVNTPVLAEDQTPLVDGEYKLENGTTISVVAGIVNEISETAVEEATPETPVAVEEATPETPVTMEEATPETPETPAVDSELASRVSELEMQLAQVLELLQGLATNQEVAMSKIEESFSKIEEIASAPATESIKTGRVVEQGFSSTISVKDEIAELREIQQKKTNSYGFTATKGN